MLGCLRCDRLAVVEPRVANLVTLRFRWSNPARSGRGPGHRPADRRHLVGLRAGLAGGRPIPRVKDFGIDCAFSRPIPH